MKIFVWANKKGGVGKTTGTCNLAGALAQLGYKVLAVDMDPQANLTYVFMGTRTPQASVYDVLMDQEDEINTSDVILPTKVENIDVLPSDSRSMEGAERDFMGLIGEQLLLKNRLRELEPTSYDYVVIDSPPNLGILTINSIAAADEVIIPVTPGVFAMQGILDLLRIIKLVKKNLKQPNPNIAGFVLNSVEQTNVTKDVTSQLIATFPDQLLHTQIPKNVTLEEAHSRNGTIFQYSPTSKGAEAYLALAKEVIDYEQS